MYCPNCGWNNSEVKFCTRCGTNLSVVTDALTGKPGGGSQVDERVVKLIKDYHKGRRDTVTGAALIPAGLIVMAILVAAGMPAIASFFIVCWMFFWGASALAVGLGKWFASDSELKALGYNFHQPLLPRPAQERLPENTLDASTPKYETDPVNFPGSVTENTTRHLEESAYRPPAEGSK
jgi:hypothetical protein